MNDPSRDADTVKQSAGGADPAATTDPTAVGTPGSAPDITPASGELPRLADDVAPPAHTEAGGTMEYAGRPEGTTDFLPNELPAETGRPPGGDTRAAEADRALPRPGRGAAVPGTVAGYEILGVLGRGAMGVVYKARQRGLKRLVALKMILAGDHASERDLARFRAEAEAVARLQHPNIVQIYEVGAEDGRPFFSLEFVDGITLAKMVSSTPLPEREAAGIMLALARGMHVAHEAGVIHRDLKPANVLLAADGTPKISDFGLAKQVEEDSGQTRSGTILGTPNYMAPEQAEGRNKDVGPLSDVYGLGAILYELLTGRAPFRAATVLETLDQVRNQEPVAPHLLRPGVARDLETICLRCLQKEPARRYASAAELADDLARFVNGEPIRARPVSTAERLARWCRRNPGLASLTGAVAVLLVAIAGVSSAFAWQVQVKNDELKHTNDNLNRTNEELVLSNQAKEEARQKAEKNAEEARRTYSTAYERMIQLGRNVYGRLLDQREGSESLSPEQRKLREDMAKILSSHLLKLAGDFERSGVTAFSKIGGLKALGDLLSQDFGHKQAGLQQYQKARQLLEPIVAAEPENDLARGNLALVLGRVGEVSADLGGDLDRARGRLEEAVRFQRAIVEHPRSKAYAPLEARRLLANYLLARGKLCLRQGDPAAARPDLEEAVRLRQEWNDATPAQPAANKLAVRSLLAETHCWLGIAGWHLGDAAATDAALGKALATCKEFARRTPRDFGFQEDLADVYGACGDARLHRGRPAEALEYYRKSLVKVRLALRGLSGIRANIARRTLLARTYDRLGTAAEALPEHRAEAAGSFDDACKTWAGLLDDVPDDPLLVAASMRSLARCGRDAEAVTRANALRKKAPDSAEFLFQVACCFGRCAGRADDGLRQPYTAQGLAALRAAIKRGYRDAVVLRTEPDLAALRADPGFRDVLRGR
jgi:serine/threonine protein kinase